MNEGDTDSWYGKLDADAGSPDVGCGWAWRLLFAVLAAGLWIRRRHDGTPLWQWLLMVAMVLAMEALLCR